TRLDALGRESYRACLSYMAHNIFRMASTVGRSVDNGAHLRAHHRSAGETTLQGHAIRVECPGSQLAIKSNRIIFSKRGDRLCTKCYRDSQLSPAGRFRFRRSYVGYYILRNFIPDMEENIIGTALAGNKPIPFFFIKVNDFPNERFFVSRDHPRCLGDPLESLQMSYVLFEIEKLKTEIPGQTQTTHPPMPIHPVEDQSQGRSLYQRSPPLFQIRRRISFQIDSLLDYKTFLLDV